MFVDGNRLLSYFRLDPDGRRVLFGGRLHLRDIDERTAAQGSIAGWCGSGRAPRLSHHPRLEGQSRRSRSIACRTWACRAACTFAMGCNGSGVAMATYLGHQSALKILGRQNRPCRSSSCPFPRTWRTGGALVPAGAGLWYRILDGLDGWKRA